jgi:uncharacterized protein with HEPN domain
MSRSKIEFLRHILLETEFLLRESEPLSFEEFYDNEILKRAFTRSLEIIGEAAKSVDSDFRSQFADIDWRGMAGMRDKLIHHYFGVDYELVWEVIQNHIPELNFQITGILKKSA